MNIIINNFKNHFFFRLDKLFKFKKRSINKYKNKKWKKRTELLKQNMRR